MNIHPTPYTPPRRRSRVTHVKGAVDLLVTLSPLVNGMVTGTLGTVPLTSAVYAQIPSTTGPLDQPIAWVTFDDQHELLGLIDGHVVRAPGSASDLPQLILTEGVTP
ncbi:hypothetical protein [Arthrobacter sp. H35-D1]|uniref:hypothetical protein n=1 Tax=Arthrobacter sp. H35-D1 TaxID=3046202 RepID=UPI0024BB45B0|nr:hypothetical protein [Arthrobacter sp. H35-D1]MDJ0315069.1 hypothetical protein [Arthrobacter sp. H35-D1]